VEGPYGGSLSNAEFKPDTMVYAQIRAICTLAVLHLSIGDCANQTFCTCSILNLIFQFMCRHNKARLKLKLTVGLYHLRKRSVKDLFSWYSLLYSQIENHSCFFSKNSFMATMGKYIYFEIHFLNT